MIGLRAARSSVDGVEQADQGFVALGVGYPRAHAAIRVMGIARGDARGGEADDLAELRPIGEGMRRVIESQGVIPPLDVAQPRGLAPALAAHESIRGAGEKTRPRRPERDGARLMPVGAGVGRRIVTAEPCNRLEFHGRTRTEAGGRRHQGTHEGTERAQAGEQRRGTGRTEVHGATGRPANAVDEAVSKDRSAPCAARLRSKYASPAKPAPAVSRLMRASGRKTQEPSTARSAGCRPGVA
jgi:hypothetical protein